MSKSKPGKHGSAKARIELEDIFTGQKKSHVGTVTDSINIPLIEKGSAIITHIQGNEVHAMDNKTYEALILPTDPEMNLEAGGEIQWMEAMGRYKISRDHQFYRVKYKGKSLTIISMSDVERSPYRQPVTASGLESIEKGLSLIHI